MTDRYPLPEWPGYTVSADGVVYNKRGTALTHDSLGRVALRNQGRLLRVHVGECLKMAGLIHAPHADKNCDAIVARCKELEEELAETQKRLTDQKELSQYVKTVEQERDLAEAGLKKARAELEATKVANARKARAIAEKPTSSSKATDVEDLLRRARKANAHLIALLDKRGVSAPLNCFLEQSGSDSAGTSRVAEVGSERKKVMG
ncbi:hypothetical protein [Desulfovibrio desulfuricans]|uniref:hypothetical protein n=1 Tax=Desulfovibrio desulfuricans TaxID=876 RepID=UPI00398402AF